MPYRDPEVQKAASREANRRRRVTGTDRKPKRKPGPAFEALRLETARDVLAELAHQIAALKAAKLSTIERARSIGYLCGVALRGIETADFASRLEEIERALGSTSPHRT